MASPRKFPSRTLFRLLGAIATGLLARWLRRSGRAGALTGSPDKPAARRAGRLLTQRPEWSPSALEADRARPTPPGDVRGLPGPEAVLALVRSRAVGTWIEARLRVLTTLADDHEGSRHQRFLVKVGEDRQGNDLTVKISHNIDLAPRVPVRAGDEFSVRGEFVWNDLGGAIHWTHHDPEGRHEGGWIKFAGKRYA